MKTSVRISHLKLGNGKGTLANAEAHGLRQDSTSQSRKINNNAPIVHGGLNLQELFEAHTKGAKMDKRTKNPAQHWLFQWPTDLPCTPESQAEMLRISTDFANNLLGGRAVFAARVDRDERNQHVIDVFCSPLVAKFNKKSGITTDWIQPSVHLKALCSKHVAELKRRHPTIKNITSQRSQGMSLQSEWANHLRGLGYDIDQKAEKRSGNPDWQPPEVIQAQHELKAREEALAASEAALAARKQHVAEVYDAMADYAEEHGIGFPPYDMKIHPAYDEPTP